jgi:16S rRNA (cytosine967-C5)-methyltransferase
MLKTKGKLLYVTCSVFNDENIKVIERFKAKIKGVRELDISFPKNIKVINNQLIPTDFHDGLFYALLEKQ